MRKEKSLSYHDKIVKKTADALIKEGYQNVKADIPGYKRPGKITRTVTQKGFKPDVTCRDEKEIIIEIETGDFVKAKHTTEQWPLFSLYCSENNAEFLIIVSEGLKDKAEIKMKDLDIKGSIIELIFKNINENE